jgi:hypothetical protein
MQRDAQSSLSSSGSMSSSDGNSERARQAANNQVRTCAVCESAVQLQGVCVCVCGEAARLTGYQACKLSTEGKVYDLC